jgi:hypothetical protein
MKVTRQRLFKMADFSEICKGVRINYNPCSFIFVKILRLLTAGTRMVSTQVGAPFHSHVRRITSSSIIMYKCTAGAIAS